MFPTKIPFSIIVSLIPATTVPPIFIGEVVDVTGHLGGYNFQWAWSSGYVAGQHA